MELHDSNVSKVIRFHYPILHTSWPPFCQVRTWWWPTLPCCHRYCHNFSSWTAMVGESPCPHKRVSIVLTVVRTIWVANGLQTPPLRMALLPLRLVPNHLNGIVCVSPLKGNPEGVMWATRQLILQ